MTSPTGKPTGDDPQLRPDRSHPQRGAGLLPAQRGAGFTLIELILVMAILVVLLGVSAPSLSRFFRARTLEAEAKRFLALTRYGQSRAVSEGLPIVLWIDSQQAAYGLQADSSYEEEDPKQLAYALHDDVQVEVHQSTIAQRQAALWRETGGPAARLPKIRFTPDGFISESSPEFIVFRQKTDGEIWIGARPNALNYAVQTNQIPRLTP